MGSCFHFEVVVRLLAGVSFARESVTRDVADGKRGPGLLSLLFENMTFSKDEIAFLPKCNTLRNKLIHCEPDAVLRLVRELAPDFTPPAVVRQLHVPPGSSGQDILNIVTEQKGAVDVLDTSSRSQGFAGWMMQAAGDGTFDQVVALVGRGISILQSKVT